MFTAYPAYSRYRTLRLASTLLQGEDVYALQTALADLGYDVGTADGIFGSQTDKAARAAQSALGLDPDGLVGPATQKALALKFTARTTKWYGLAIGALRGQVEHESGFVLGNYSPIRANGSYDAGIAQRNTEHTPADQGFNVPRSIDALGSLVADHYDLFDGLPARRRWGLAQGAWNAPAFACYIAREEGATGVPASRTVRPGTTARQAFEAYVAAVTTYLDV